jgi:P4 family phage/plasmid primase-like protien
MEEQLNGSASLYNEAKNYIKLGAPVGPAEGKAIKVPSWSALSPEEFFDDKYLSFWKRATGIGVVCGESSGVICLDIDIDKAVNPQLIAEITARIPPIMSGKIGNPNRRPAQFFRYNGERSRKFNNIGVEILSTGNQTIIPPSKHPKFELYSWVGTPLHMLSDLDELPTLPDGFIEWLEQIDNEHKSPPTQNAAATGVSQAKGRCNHGSHNTLSALGVALIHQNYPFDRLMQRLIKRDKELNHGADYYYFECPSRPWKHKDPNENVKDFVEELFKRHKPNGEELTSRSEPPPAQEERTRNYEQIGFYFRYRIPKDDGGVKIVDVPQYELMADHCYDQKNMCFDDTTSLQFDGKKWEWYSKTAFQNFILTANKSVIKPAHIDPFAKMIKSRCFVKALGIKQPDGLINVDNGVIDVKSGTLLPHSHEYLFKYCSPVTFDETAECPTWNKFLMTVFNGNIELIDLAQRLFGYVLIGGRPFLHRAFVLYGNGRNGKSTFLDVLRAVIGSDAYSTVSMAKLDKEFSIVNIDGKLANIVEETPNDEINAEVFKTLVGGGEVQAAHKNFDEYTFRCNARFVFACNDMPIFKDKSIGLEERLVFLPFERYFEEHERDTQMTEKLLSELSGILNWSLQGVRVILADPKIPDYEVLKKSKETYRVETNPVYQWFKDDVDIRQDGDNITVNEVYKRYARYAQENGNRPFSKDKFIKQFRKYIDAGCKLRGVFYDKDLRSKSGDERIFNVFKWRLTGLTAFDSTKVEKPSDNYYWKNI